MTPLQADIFAGLDLVALLNTGVTGFAVVMLFISYRLIASAQRMVFEKDVSAFPDHDTFTGWRDLVKVQVRQTYSFMLLAGLFFFGGIGTLLYQYQAESEIVLVMQPYEEPFPRLFVSGEENVFRETGHVPLAVRTGRVLEVRTSRMYQRVRDLEAELARVTTELDWLRDSFRSATARSGGAGEESGL